MNAFPKVIQLSSCLVVGQVLIAECQTFQPVSVAEPAQQPVGGGGDSGASILSSDGRYVLFASTANNLDGVSSQLFPIIPPRINVLLRDRTTGVTTLVSVNLNGTGGGNGDSLPVDVSTNGRYAVFESSASDLVAGDTNNASDVFVRDLQTVTTILVSSATNGVAGNGYSRSPAMTPDGRYVAFVSAANNLVAGDTNGIGDVFVRDLQTGSTTLVSQGARARTGVTSFIFSTSETPSITPDGRYVLFLSEATNLVSGVPAACHIYLRDVVSAQTTWVSSFATNVTQSKSAFCFDPIMSADGRYIVYGTATNAGTRGFILYYDQQTSQSVIVHSNAAVARTAFEDIRSIDMTPDGRFVAFVANTNGISGTQTCICLWNAQTGTFDVPSLDLSGQVPANSVCTAPGISSDGRFVSFMNNGANLVTNSTAESFHAYLRDRQAATTRLLDADTNGVAGVALSPLVVPLMSGDGNLVAFECPDGNLFANDRNRSSDLIVHDVNNGTNELISLRLPDLLSTTPNGPSTASGSGVSSNGLLVAFSSDADNIVANDTNLRPDIFVRDLVAGTNFLVSADTNGFPSDGASYEPSISADGRYVALMSSGDNLVPNVANHTFDVFRRDILTGTTALVSVNSSGVSGNKNSRSPIMAGSGRYVLFLSSATDMIGGASTGENLYCRDMDAGMTFALTTNGASVFSVSRDSTFVAVGVNVSSSTTLSVWNCASSSWVYSNGPSSVLSLKISPDGQRIAYVTLANANLHTVDWATATDRTIGTGISPARTRFSGDGNLLVYGTTVSQSPTDTNGLADIYLYDFQFGTNSLISRSYTGGAASGASDSPDISTDGRFVAYRSGATNIVSSDINGVGDVFVYDRVTQATTLLSASHIGNRSGSHISMAPFFSADGKTVIFESWASDLVPHDFNGTGDVFVYGLSDGSPIPVFYAKILPDTNASQARWLTWPASQGNAYRVQYKNDLADNWQELGGNVTILGGQGFLRDPGPTQMQRYYRVVASEP